MLAMVIEQVRERIYSRQDVDRILAQWAAWKRSSGNGYPSVSSIQRVRDGMLGEPVSESKPPKTTECSPDVGKLIAAMDRLRSQDQYTRQLVKLVNAWYLSTERTNKSRAQQAGRILGVSAHTASKNLQTAKLCIMVCMNG